MTVEEQVQRAQSPREALLIVARAVDELRSAQPTLDSWDAWGEVPPRPVTQAAMEAIHRNSMDTPAPEPAPAKVTDDEVRAWIGRNYGRTPADDAEGRAIIAQVRDDLERSGPPPVRLPPEVRMGEDGIIETDIDFSPMTESHRVRRYDFAKNILQLDVALGEHPTGGDWAEDYAKTGPLPLYILNRDLLMQYPDQVKAAMVADVASYDQRMGYEMGADVLKQPMIKDDQSPAGRVSVDAEQ